MLTYVAAALLVVLYSLGSLTPRWAEAAIADRLQAAMGPFASLHVKLRSDPPIRALGGAIEGIEVQAQGFAVQGVPVASATLETGSFNLPTLPMVLGQPARLAAPLEATVSALVTESALNVVAHSPRVAAQLKGIPIQISLWPGLPPITRKVDFLLGALHVTPGRLSVEGTVDMGAGQQIPFTASAQPVLSAPNVVTLQGIQATMMGSPVPSAYLAGVRQSLDLTPYQAPGARFRVLALDLAAGEVRLAAGVTVTDLALGAHP